MSRLSLPSGEDNSIRTWHFDLKAEMRTYRSVRTLHIPRGHVRDLLKSQSPNEETDRHPRLPGLLPPDRHASIRDSSAQIINPNDAAATREKHIMMYASMFLSAMSFLTSTNKSSVPSRDQPSTHAKIFIHGELPLTSMFWNLSSAIYLLYSSGDNASRLARRMPSSKWSFHRLSAVSSIDTSTALKSMRVS
ncbi:hypothetical protein CDEST_04235 [Colletotrichum destructivum]|uniref:Uncharacterized protein n=1 Tax=Colletotrichum destructivum TaxID=34406 RepID=A0AAX4I763_9PEZI|nr:hypothetical protein CDEST_04235 [Colletotrichum destructivum]